MKGFQGPMETSELRRGDMEPSGPQEKKKKCLILSFSGPPAPVKKNLLDFRNICKTGAGVKLSRGFHIQPGGSKMGSGTLWHFPLHPPL